MCKGVNWLFSRNIDTSDYVYLYMVCLGIKKWHNGRAGAPFLAGMEDIQPLAQWLEADVRRAKNEGIMVTYDVKDSSKPSSL